MSNIKREKENYNRNYMIVAIDIGQQKNSAIFRSPYGKDSQVFEFSNTKSGFDHFGSTIIWYKNKYDAKKIVVCFEPTGVYGEPLIHYLDSKKVPMVQVNPSNSKKARELRDNSPNKTDKKDPRVIADLVQLNCYLSVIIAKGDAAELRQLMSARERAIGFQNRCINELHALITKLFPEFFQLNKSVKSKTAQYLLQNCVDPEKVIDVDIEKLIDEVKKISRGRYNWRKVYKYQELAKDTIGVREGKKAILKEIKFLVETLEKKQNM
ncbi:transposase [candidate division KSB1 bacterium]|nr:transposase [candidate division KSB1 bacterium]